MMIGTESESAGFIYYGALIVEIRSYEASMGGFYVDGQV